MEKSEIQKKILEFKRWHYQFEIEGYFTPISDKENINRHNQRKRYFFDPLKSFLGGLHGLRVLDLGCNAGFWSLLSIEADCDFVLGIDGRAMHIDEANFVFEAKKINKSKYKFILENIFNISPNNIGTFEIVLCLGLVYHVNNPIGLLEKISAINSDILVIDTTIFKNTSENREPVFLLRQENIEDPRMAIESPFVFLPTIEGIILLLKYFGYKGVVLKPNFTSYEGATDYRDGDRRAIICSKSRDLSSFSDKSENIF